MKSASPCVGLIDVGSNSIKALIATREPDGRLVSVDHLTLDTRISQGLSAASPRLSEAGLTAGVHAVEQLFNLAQSHHVTSCTVVATNAVRGASNGAEFASRILASTGLPLRILSGDEEARLIGRGLLCDPALSRWQDFHVFDLGGGSLECLSFRGRHLVQAHSLPLGCVRLSERLVDDVTAPWSSESDQKVRDHVTKSLQAASLSFTSTSASTPAVFCSGTMTSARAILAEAEGLLPHEINPVLGTELLAAILKKIGDLPLLAARLTIPGLPERRADIMPTALATVLAPRRLRPLRGLPAFPLQFALGPGRRTTPLLASRQTLRIPSHTLRVTRLAIR
ncbi:MAG: phosphatase [Candidatus Synoicihabitans palmerolidicus]|nr:phosphatase [Candidatus Synoicihabitans palmerolidicus]